MRNQDAGMSDRGGQPPPRHENKPADGMQKADDKSAAPRQQSPKQAPHRSGSQADPKSTPKSTPKSGSGSSDARGMDRSAGNPKDVEDEMNEPDGDDDDALRQKGGKSGGRGQADGRP